MEEIRNNPSGKAWLLAPIIFFLTFAVFLPALSGDFVNWDDDKNFLANVNYRGLGWTQIHWMWTTHHMGAYVPVSWMTLGLDYTIWGMQPFGYHLTSVLWHCANAALFYLIALALFGKSTAATLGASFAALVFALHPLRAESVAWITERRDVVSGFFYLAAILFYLRRHRENERDASRRQTIRRRYYWACLGCFTVAVFAKVMTVTLPAILLLLDVYPLRRLGGGRGKWFGAAARKVWIEKLPFFAIAMVGSALAFYSLRNQGLTTIGELGWFPRIVITIYGLAFYLWKTLVPLQLAPFYAITPHRLDPHALPALASLAVVMCILTAAILLRRRLPVFTAAAVAYVITLLPVVGIFHNGQQIAADRYSYLPCLGWALLAGACVLAAWKACERSALGKGVVAVAAAGLAIMLGVLGWRQAAHWIDSRTLWTHAVAVEPSFIAWDHLGMVLSEGGDSVGAIADYHKSIQLYYEHPYSHNNLGASLLVLEDWEEAIREFQIALKIKPDMANTHHGWGYALVRLGKVEEGIVHLQTALRLAPDYETARKSLEWAMKLRKPASGE